MRQLLLLIQKDIRIEGRQLDMLVAGAGLALLLAAVAFFGVQSAFLKVAFEHALFPAFVWICYLFASTTVQAKSFQHEFEHGAIDALRLLGISAEKIYLAKLLSFLLCSSLIFLTVFIALFFFFNIPFDSISLSFVLVTGLILLAHNSLTVLFAALSERSGLQSILFPLVVFPLLFPLFLAAVELYAAFLIDQSFFWGSAWISLLLIINVVYFLLGYTLFRVAISE